MPIELRVKRMQWHRTDINVRSRLYKISTRIHADDYTTESQANPKPRRPTGHMCIDQHGENQAHPMVTSLLTILDLWKPSGFNCIEIQADPSRPSAARLGKLPATSNIILAAPMQGKRIQTHESNAHADRPTDHNAETFFAS